MDMLKALLIQQNKMQEALGYNVKDMSYEDRADYIKEYSLHMTHELHEMLTELPFLKSWKQYRYYPEVMTTQYNKMRAEWIDVLHFFLNITLALGFDADDLFEAYDEKQSLNFFRQEDTENYKKCVE